MQVFTFPNLILLISDALIRFGCTQSKLYVFSDLLEYRRQRVICLHGIFYMYYLSKSSALSRVFKMKKKTQRIG